MRPGAPSAAEEKTQISQRIRMARMVGQIRVPSTFPSDPPSDRCYPGARCGTPPRMLLALLLATGPALQHHAPPATMEGRVNLLEARQMLEAQQLWSIRAELPPEALKALGDLELHVQ